MTATPLIFNRPANNSAPPALLLFGDAAPTQITVLKAYTATGWVTGALKRWNGTSWAAANFKRNTASGWA